MSEVPRKTAELENRFNLSFLPSGIPPAVIYAEFVFNPVRLLHFITLTGVIHNSVWNDSNLINADKSEEVEFSDPFDNLFL